MRARLGALALAFGCVLLATIPASRETGFALDRLLGLAAAHLTLALSGAAIGIALGVALGVLVTREIGRAWRQPVDAFAAATQAAPPMVVVALALPAFGFGPVPTILALVLYGLMPVLRGTIAALEATPPDAREAARAMGFTAWQTLAQVEFPLAWPLLLPAIRIGVMLAIATTAVGALAGAASLGTPIVIGLQAQNQLYILQGAAATAALAFLADALLASFAKDDQAGAISPRSIT